MMHPQWMRPAPRKNPKAAFGLDYEDVSFQTEGGATLRGWFVPARQSDVGVVTVHGAGANRSEFLAEAKMLHDAGYPVLLFDCRGHGASDEVGRGISLGAREHRDVEAAASYARQSRDMERVVVIGCSQWFVSRSRRTVRPVWSRGWREPQSLHQPQAVPRGEVLGPGRP